MFHNGNSNGLLSKSEIMMSIYLYQSADVQRTPSKQSTSGDISEAVMTTEKYSIIPSHPIIIDYIMS